MRKTLLLIALMTACSFVNAQTVDAVSKGGTECAKDLKEKYGE